jgi:hypothetical protein
LKAVYDIQVSSAATVGAFKPGFDTFNLHRPTVQAAAFDVKGGGGAAL